MRAVTADLFNEEQWQQYQPTTIRGFRWRNKYVGFYGAEGADTGFIYDPSGGENAFTEFRLPVVAAFQDPDSDDLFVLYDHATLGRRYGVFNEAATALVYRWRSKTFLQPRPMAMSVAKVLAETYPVTLRVYADDALVFDQAITDPEPRRLPVNFRARKWALEIESSNPVEFVGLYDSMHEAF